MALFDSKNIDECYQVKKGEMLEAAREVDRRANEIAALESQVKSSNRFDWIHLKKITILKQKVVPVPKGQWQQWDWGWADILEEFRTMDRNDSWNWYNLRNEINGQLLSDRNRILWNDPFLFSHLDVKTLQTLKTKLEDCLGLEACHLPELTSTELSLLSKTHTYAALWKSASEEAGGKSSLKSLFEEVVSDWKPNTFKRTAPLERTATGDFLLTLDIGDFDGDQTELGRFIEEAWTTKTNKLLIHWVLNPIEETFRLLLDPKASGRAFFQRKTKTVHLGKTVRAKGLAHEIGHVLGFPDTYFEIWNQEKCNYTSEYLDSDIMSEQNSGSVTPEMWKQLEEAY